MQESFALRVYWGVEGLTETYRISQRLGQVKDLIKRIGLLHGDHITYNGQVLEQNGQPLQDGDHFDVFLAEPAELDLVPRTSVGESNISVTFYTVQLGMETEFTFPLGKMGQITLDMLVKLFKEFYEGDMYLVFVDGTFIDDLQVMVKPNDTVKLMIIGRLHHSSVDIEPDSEEEVNEQDSND